MKKAINAPALIERKSDERDVFALANELRTRVSMVPVFRVRGETLGAGAYVTLWNDDIPTGAAVYVKATVIGVGTGNNAWYEIQEGVRNTAGVLSVIGATAVTVSREDAAAADARFGTTGDTLYLEVRDDAVNAMAWTAYIATLTAA